MLVATAIWLGGRRALWVLAFPPVALELYYGNVNLLIAAAIALGFRYPAAWSFVLLTKVTPGVGLLWFAVRREWRQLAIALGVTAVIVAASVALDGRLWARMARGVPEGRRRGPRRPRSQSRSGSGLPIAAGGRHLGRPNRSAVDRPARGHASRCPCSGLPRSPFSGQ